MPRISVVVPIYNVERYLEPCLESLAAQTFADFEAVMVDDGSTDRSPAIAAAFAARDPRFRLVRQENGGLSKARNTGVDAATGEFLGFLDSDDLLPPSAYEHLLGALQRTGSDFATGNVYRLDDGGTSQAAFLAATFTRTRLRTHVTRFRALIADRVVWNKLYRRAFWDEHGYRFPEGRIHEDIPVVVPAQFAARSVDVIAEPVYFWRVRGGSITQRRLEERSLIDRLRAIEEVREHLRREGPRRARRWYDASVVADDLELHLNALHLADHGYQELFLERANAFVDTTGDRVFRGLAAIDRLKWHLVRRRQLPELLEVLRFEREELEDTPPVRRRGRWYGDYPFRGDPRLAVPSSVYRLGRSDLPGVAHVDAIEDGGGRILIRGRAYVGGIGAPSARSQRVTVSAVRPGRLRRVQLLVRPLRLRTRSVPLAKGLPVTGRGGSDLSWAGFEAGLDVSKARRRMKARTGARWELYVTIRAGGVTRRRVRFAIDDLAPVAAAAGDGTAVEVIPTEAGGVDLRLRAGQPA